MTDKENNMDGYDRAARAAAKYWADFLRKGAPLLDNGDRSSAGAMTFMLAMLAQPKDVVPEDAAQRFEDVLTAKIRRQLPEGYNSAEPWRTVYVNVDYEPCRLLHEAATEADVDLGGVAGRLPWKTGQHVMYDQVRVSQGYGAKYVDIFDERSDDVKRDYLLYQVRNTRESFWSNWTEYNGHHAWFDVLKAKEEDREYIRESLAHCIAEMYAKEDEAGLDHAWAP